MFLEGSPQGEQLKLLTTDRHPVHWRNQAGLSSRVETVLRGHNFSSSWTTLPASCLFNTRTHARTHVHTHTHTHAHTTHTVMAIVGKLSQQPERKVFTVV